MSKIIVVDENHPLAQSLDDYFKYMERMNKVPIQDALEVRRLAVEIINKEDGNGTPDKLAKILEDDKNWICHCLSTIHVSRELYANKTAQDSCPIFVTWDGNNEFPVAYGKNGNTEAYLKNPY